MKNLPSICLTITILVFCCACVNKTGQASDNSGDSVSIGTLLSDTLKVVTLYGPTSYFNYRGEELGFDYENVKKFAESENLVLDLQIAPNIPEMIDRLKTGKADLAAYPVPYIAEYNDEIIHCGPKEITWQVLIQKESPERISDVTQLVGKEVTVEKGSKYQFRMENLNDELGGGVKINAIQSDTITSEDFLRMVNKGEIKYAVVDSEIVSLEGNDYPMIDTSLRVSLEQAASWAVAPNHKDLAEKVDNWEKNIQDSPAVKEIYKRYYTSGKNIDSDPFLSYFTGKNLKGGSSVSPYDAIFRRYASQAGFDWELLAAIAYCESRFETTAQSRFGATGLMQVMPSSGRAYGVAPSALFDPDRNVYAASKIIAALNSSLADKVPDQTERMRFMLAGYNAGLGHIYDAMALAEKYDMDPGKWTGNVSVAALMKSRPEYYNDPVVKHGYFRGRETVDFVEQVMSVYSFIKSKSPS